MLLVHGYSAAMRREFRLVIFLLIGGAVAYYTSFRQPGPPPPVNEISKPESEFTTAFSNDVASAIPQAKVRISGRLQVKVDMADGISVTSNLDNAWNECRDHPENQTAVRQRYLKSLLESLAAFQSASVIKIEEIIPLIKDTTFLDGITDKPVNEPYIGDLHLVYAANNSTGFIFLGQADFEKLKVGLAELRSRAIENLRKAIQPVKQIGTGPLYAVETDRSLEASALLLDDFWDEQAKRVDGDLVAAVPSRDTLFFTGEKSSTGMAHLKDDVDKIQKKGDHLVSKRLFVRRNGKWQAL
jgi:uncharacterized protein YtpQ (UPF0354 family)